VKQNTKEVRWEEGANRMLDITGLSPMKDEIFNSKDLIGNKILM